MDNQYIKDKLADTADKQVTQAKEIAKEAHKSAADEHKKEAEEEEEENNSQ